MQTLALVESSEDSPGRADQQLTYAIWQSASAPDDALELGRLLCRGDEHSRVYSTLKEWVSSGARVLVVRGSENAEVAAAAWTWEPSVEEHRVLRSSKVLGFGYEAAKVFGSLGLEINDEIYGSSSSRRRPSLLLADTLAISSGAPTRVAAFASLGAKPPPAEVTCTGLTVPAWSFLTQCVDVLARWIHDPRLAAIAQQGGYALVCPSSPITQWSEGLKSVVRDIARRLLDRKSEVLVLPEWPIAPAGRVAFELAPDGDLAMPSSRAFHFRFTTPTVFRATFSFADGSAPLAYFEATRSGRDVAQDRSEFGSRVDIVVPISEASIAANDGGFWRLEVWNLGSTETDVQGTIRYGVGGVVSLLGGSVQISVDSPPTDPSTIRQVMQLFLSADPATKREAQAGLMIIGPPALELLEREWAEASSSGRINHELALRSLIIQMRQQSVQLAESRAADGGR